jgi:hypothetical protein
MTESAGHRTDWERMARFAILGSWVIFAILLVQSFPIQHSRIVMHLLWVPITLLGLLAGVWAAFSWSRWKGLALAAASAFVLHWVFRIVESVAMWLDLDPFLKALAQPFIIRWAALERYARELNPWFVSFAFNEVVMPLLQMVLVVYLLRLLTAGSRSDAPQAARA